MSTADEIKERINELPKGSISKKQVNGKTYFYHRWHEDGKLKEKYIPEEDIAELKKRIDERRKLESYLRGFHSSSNSNCTYCFFRVIKCYFSLLISF